MFRPRLAPGGARLLMLLVPPLLALAALGAAVAFAPNQAGLLRDGEQVKVPALKGTAGSAKAAPVDLNAATEDQLAAVPGFTRDLARETIRYRVNFGGFQKTTELVSAVGMDPAAFAI